MLLNITIASLMMMATTAVHAGGISLIIFIIKSHKHHWATSNTLIWLSLIRMQRIGGVVLLMFLLSLLEMAAWATLYLHVGAVDTFEKALYFSTVTFTTLGYGDILLDANWRLLAAFEAVNGIIIFGLSTAVVVSAVQRIYFYDLPNDQP